MNLSEVIDHCAYAHKTLGPVWIVGRHPHDGAALIICRYDDEQDEEVYDLIEACELTHMLLTDEFLPVHGRAQEHYYAAKRGEPAPVSTTEVLIDLLKHGGVYLSAIDLDHGFNGEEWEARAVQALGYRPER